MRLRKKWYLKRNDDAQLSDLQNTYHLLGTERNDGSNTNETRFLLDSLSKQRDQMVIYYEECKKSHTQFHQTSIFWKRHNKRHTLSRRCGSRSYVIQKKTYYRMKKHNWSEKAKWRRTQRVGYMRHLNIVFRKFRNGFRDGVHAINKR